MQKLKLMKSGSKAPLLEKVAREQGDPGSATEILEAGCGQRWLLKLDGKKFFLTEVDLDSKALELRKNVRRISIRPSTAI